MCIRNASSAAGGQVIAPVRAQCTFGRSDVLKLHAAAALSTFASQTAQNTSGVDPCVKFGSGNCTPLCEKHVYKSKCTRNQRFEKFFVGYTMRVK